MFCLFLFLKFYFHYWSLNVKCGIHNFWLIVLAAKPSKCLHHFCCFADWNYGSLIFSHVILIVFIFVRLETRNGPIDQLFLPVRLCAKRMHSSRVKTLHFFDTWSKAILNSVKFFEVPTPRTELSSVDNSVRKTEGASADWIKVFSHLTHFAMSLNMEW